MVNRSSTARFTSEDLNFLVKALARTQGDATSLRTFLSEEETLDQLLDHPSLHEQMVDSVGCLRVSPAFYFYVLVRHVLRRAGILDRLLCDYISGVLTDFSRMQHLAAHTPGGTNTFAYVSDLLMALEKKSGDEAFHLRVHLGNFSLFMTGIFAERIQASVLRHGAPGIRFYESIGQSSYQTAARDPHAKSAGVRELYGNLAEQFHLVRVALNAMTEKNLHVHAPAI